MKIKPIMRFSAAIAFAVSAIGNAYATDYLIAMPPYFNGEYHEDAVKYRGPYKDRPFQWKTDWFKSWDDVAGRLQPGDNVYIHPNVGVGNITVSVSGVNIYGNNKDCLGWYGTDTQGASSETRLIDETNVTGRITIAGGVSNVTICGFRFTGDGQVFADGGNNSNIQLLNNVIENINAAPGNTTGGETNKAVFYFGRAYRSDALNSAAYKRYQNITIAHNDFRGRDIDNEADWIQVSGSYGSLDIHDNHFLYGGNGVNIFNAMEKVNILHNRFDKVGNGKKYGTATGSFAVRLFYLGLSSSYPVDAYIRHNVFDGCQGQSSKYAIIRLYNNNDNGYTPAWANLFINHNYFQGKTSTVNESRSDTDGTKLGLGTEPKYDHNYVYYADISVNKDANVDWRFNRFENSEYEFAYLISPWERWRASSDKLFPGRYYASLSGVFEHTTPEYKTGDDNATGTQCDFYGKKHKDGTYFGGKCNVWADGYATDYLGTDYDQGRRFRPGSTTTVVQSFDRDDETGDLYFIQVRNKSYGNDMYGIKSNCEKPVVITKVDVATKDETQMYIDYGGHGSNMSVYRYKGQVYIVMGGNQASATTSDPEEILIFPFVPSNSNIDLRNASFYVNGTSYKIAHKKPSIPYDSYINGNTIQHFVYPSIDRANNLYVERQRSLGGDYFTVYEADDIFNCVYNGNGTPKIIGRCYIAAGAEKIGSTSKSSARPQLNNYDQGFKTWDDQGFTIAGDYIYTFEGNGDDDTTHPDPDEVDGMGAVQLINCINWRNGTFMYRRHINKESTYNTANNHPESSSGKKLDGPAIKSAGEPEGIKVFRDHTGRAQLVIGVVSEQTGDRRYNLYAYRQRRTLGGRELTKTAYNNTLTTKIPDAVHGTSTNSLYFEGNSEQSTTFNITNNGESRNVHATLVGEHAEYFTLTPHTSYYANGTDMSLLPTDNDADSGSPFSWVRTDRDYACNSTLTYTKGWDTAHTGEHNYTRGYTVTFKPSIYIKDYDKAWIKLATPGAEDIYIPIRAMYTGPVTAVENITKDGETLEVEGYYDLTGRRVVNPEGFVIVRYTNGTAQKIFVR